MNLDEQAINVFTDGSSLQAPRRGGTGICFITVSDDGHEVIDNLQPQGHHGATNQQMELLACIQALRELRGKRSPVDVDRFTKIVIHSDSQYVVNNVSNALYSWRQNGWCGNEGNPILNAELWNDLVSEIFKAPKRVYFEWVKGHSAKNPHNKTADKLAKGSAKGALAKPLAPVRVRRKLSSKKSIAGSIVPDGQDITIRVIVDRWLPRQKMYAYKIEVVSVDSPYFENVDDFTSDQMISAGHSYEVRLNDNPKNPRIEEVYREVEARGSERDSLR
jgi:ribonuclease HI